VKKDGSETEASVPSQKVVNKFKLRRSEIAQPRAQEGVKKSTATVMLSVHSLRLPMLGMTRGAGAGFRLLNTKGLAPCVMQSKAKHRCICIMKQIRGCFLRFTQDRLRLLRMTGSVLKCQIRIFSHVPSPGLASRSSSPFPPPRRAEEGEIERGGGTMTVTGH
jgi:hypothetical protein